MSNLNLDNKTVLITGGAGFIGSNLAFYFQENHPNCKVIVFDIFNKAGSYSLGHFKNLVGFNGEIIAGDITKKEDIEKLEAFDIDYVFHEAAISDTTVKDQFSMIQTNVNAFKDLLLLCKRKGARMIYASSGATYGDAPSPQRVGFENPQNVYGFSKLMMDNISKEYSKKYDITIIGLRYFNVYGRREFYKDKTASMVLQLGLQILDDEKPRLFFDSDKILRDFVYIDDVISANILAMSAPMSGIYNVATSKPRSFQDIADILQVELKTNLKTHYFHNPHSGYQMHTQADISSTKEELGYEPKFTLEEGIREYIPYIKHIHESEFKWRKKGLSKSSVAKKLL